MRQKQARRSVALLVGRGAEVLLCMEAQPLAVGMRALALLEVDPDRRVIAEGRGARDRTGVDAPVDHSSLGLRIPEDVIELISAPFRCEECLLLLGAEAQPQITRPGPRPNLAEAEVPAGEPWDVVLALRAVQIAAP